MKEQEKLTQISVRVSAQERQQFKVICAQEGTTGQDVLYRYVQKIIKAGKIDRK